MNDAKIPMLYFSLTIAPQQKAPQQKTAPYSNQSNDSYRNPTNWFLYDTSI